MQRFLLAAAIAAAAPHVAAADFATPGGPLPSGLDEVVRTFDTDGASMELMLSFGTSKGGSAGHLALALRDASGVERVHSANFYADRDPAHEANHYTKALMVTVPKWEYLYGTSSTLDPKASFGLDFGEIYKRSVVGIRVFGVPASEREALAAYFDRMNADFAAGAHDTEYQRGEVKYSYTDLNCAKTVGSAFRYGAGYKELELRSAPALAVRKLKTYLDANTPSEMAMKLMREMDARGYKMDAVLYRKYPGSPYLDPHDEEPISFGNLPNRIPSMVSLDFRNDEGHYEDYDNLFASYTLHNIGRYGVAIDPATKAVAIRVTKTPMTYAEATALAAKDAEADSKGFLHRLFFPARGKRVDG
jgi:hypothetical protein